MTQPLGKEIIPPEGIEESSSSRLSLRVAPKSTAANKRRKDDREVLSEDWASEYFASAAQNSMAAAVFGGGTWHEKIQLWQGKLMREGLILVPEKLVRRAVWAQHTRSGHFWRGRLVRELKRRFFFPPLIEIWKEVAEVRAQCRVRQAWGAEN